MCAEIDFFDVRLPLPSAGVDLAGFYPPRKWNGSGGGIYASFMRVTNVEGKTLLLGSFDVLFVDSSFKNKLQERLGNSFLVILVASHTHSAPALAKSVNSLGRVDRSWYESVIDAVVNAIHQGNEGEATLKINYSSVKTSLNVNRRKEALVLDYSALKSFRFKFSKQVTMSSNFNGVVDDEIKVVTFKNSDDKVIACIWSFAAHPVFFHDRNGISPDFPGLVRQRIKEVYGEDCVSIFLPGLAGSSIPNCKAKRFWDKTLKEKLMGILPFHSAINPVDVKAYSKWCEDLSYHVVRATIGLFASTFKASEVACKSILTPPIFIDQTRGGLGMNICVLRLSDSLFIEIANGELLSEWVTTLAKRSADKVKRITSGYGSGECLYIPPNIELSKGGYEVERFKGSFGLDGSFISDIDRVFITALNQANKID